MEIRKILISLLLLFTIVSCSFNLGKGGAKGKDGLDGTSAITKTESDSSMIKK